VSDTRIGLDVELEVLKSGAGGPAPGTTLLYHYDLSRNAGSQGRIAATSGANIAPSASRTTGKRSAAESNRKCKRTVWQTRNVASLSSAPMIMVQVPKCVEW